jgi:hypothetical protein
VALAVVGGAAVLVALGVATLAWSARVGRRHGGWWRLLPVAALVGMAATVLGPLSGVGWMAWGFDQAATADPSDKARVVADAISAGMFAGLAGGGAGRDDAPGGAGGGCGPGALGAPGGRRTHLC